eukprot:1136861-Pelagomonas_calceolata.AAC.13
MEASAGNMLATGAGAFVLRSQQATARSLVRGKKQGEKLLERASSTSAQSSKASAQQACNAQNRPAKEL